MVPEAPKVVPDSAEKKGSSSNLINLFQVPQRADVFKRVPEGSQKGSINVVKKP